MDVGGSGSWKSTCPESRKEVASLPSLASPRTQPGPHQRDLLYLPSARPAPGLLPVPGWEGTGLTPRPPPHPAAAPHPGDRPSSHRMGRTGVSCGPGAGEEEWLGRATSWSRATGQGQAALERSGASGVGLEEMPWDNQEIRGRGGPPVSCETGHLPKTMHFLLKDRKEGVCPVPTSRSEGSVLWAPHTSSGPAVDLGLFSSVGHLSFWTQLGPSDISCPGPKAFIRVRREPVLPSGGLLGVHFSPDPRGAHQPLDLRPALASTPGKVQGTGQGESHLSLGTRSG